MTSHVKQFVLLCLLNIAAAVSKVSSTLKTTINGDFIYWSKINKIHTHRDQQSCCNCYDNFTAQQTAVCGICSCSIVVNRCSWAAWGTSLPCSTFMSHHNTDHTCDSPEMRKIYRLHYGAVNRSHSQQMCKCSTTPDNAECLHAVQKCGCKIVLRERK